MLIEITGYASPCETIAASFLDGDVGRVAHALHPGESRLYARVLTEGAVAAGDPVQRIDRAAAAPPFSPLS